MIFAKWVWSRWRSSSFLNDTHFCTDSGNNFATLFCWKPLLVFSLEERWNNRQIGRNPGASGYCTRFSSGVKHSRDLPWPRSLNSTTAMRELKPEVPLKWRISVRKEINVLQMVILKGNVWDGQRKVILTKSKVYFPALNLEITLQPWIMSSRDEARGSIPASTCYQLKSDQLWRNTLGLDPPPVMLPRSVKSRPLTLEIHCRRTFGFALSSTQGCDLILAVKAG